MRSCAFAAGLAALTITLLALVSSCDALIGTEDRFFASADADESRDATADAAMADATRQSDADTIAPDAGVAVDAADAADGQDAEDAGPLSDYAAEVNADLPVAWWRFEDKVGSTYAVDSLGLHPAALIGEGTAFGVDGAVGNAVMLDGEGYLDVGDYFDLSDQGFTFEAWVKSDWHDYYDIFIKHDSAANGYALLLQDGPQLQYTEQFGGRSDGMARENPPALAISDFVYVVVTFDPGAGIEMYINGVRTDSANVVPADATMFGHVDAGLHLGYHLIGQLDEAALYAHALTLARISVHYQARTASP